MTTYKTIILYIKHFTQSTWFSKQKESTTAESLYCKRFCNSSNYMFFCVCVSSNISWDVLFPRQVRKKRGIFPVWQLNRVLHYLKTSANTLGLFSLVVYFPASTVSHCKVVLVPLLMARTSTVSTFMRCFASTRYGSKGGVQRLEWDGYEADRTKLVDSYFQKGNCLQVFSGLLKWKFSTVGIIIHFFPS